MKNQAKTPKTAAGGEYRGKPDEPAKQRFPGIVQDAKALGVSRVHLWLVLTGKRESAALKARYEVLKSRQRPGG